MIWMFNLFVLFIDWTAGLCVCVCDGEETFLFVYINAYKWNHCYLRKEWERKVYIYMATLNTHLKSVKKNNNYDKIIILV